MKKKIVSLGFVPILVCTVKLTVQWLDLSLPASILQYPCATDD